MCACVICLTVPNCVDLLISANQEAWLFLQMGALQPLAVFERACIFSACPNEFRIGDGYKAAVTNYGFLANAVLTTNDAVKAMK